jgi:hypothetical protein
LKFLCVKLVIFFVFWQTFVLSVLGYFKVFKQTEYWSVDNIEIGISALLICCEMVVFAIMHNYSFTYEPYVVANVRTPLGKSLRDGFNPVDLIKEVGWAIQDIFYLCTGRTVPVRDGHLSGTLKRATTLRAQNRVFQSNGKGRSKESNGADTIVDPSALEAGGKFEPHQQAPLLSQVDGHRAQGNPPSYPFAAAGVGHESYEMSPQQQLQHQQDEQNQQQQQYYQQQQQQNMYASRPTDGYQY